MPVVNVKSFGNVFQFRKDDFCVVDARRGTPYWFEREMISACSPLFDNLEDNHDVEDKLVKAKVITEDCNPDSECSALVVNFKTKTAARSFIQRLNKYLIKKAEAFAKAREL